MGSRPRGISSSTERSRSPKMTIAAVRGMGVAVITSRSGSAASSERSRPLSRSAARCSTPKRCCSSMTTTPRARKRTSSVNKAWVPTTMSTDPSRRPSSTAWRSLARSRPVSSWIDSGRTPPRTAVVDLRQSLEVLAQTTRGVARRAPRSAPSGRLVVAPSIDASNAVNATTVLPEPTSPWRSRCMGSGDERSAAISPSTRRCAAVKVKW